MDFVAIPMDFSASRLPTPKILWISSLFPDKAAMAAKAGGHDSDSCGRNAECRGVPPGKPRDVL
jgi:hypothetical protein